MTAWLAHDGIGEGRAREIAINVFWHAKSNKDPANMWLREAVFRMHADSPT
jgi:hypothetical protein